MSDTDPDSPAPNGTPVSAEEQLLLYARDLKLTLKREREKHAEVADLSRQLLCLNREVTRALAAEQQRSHEVIQAHNDTIMRLVHASRLRDDETGNHIRRVSMYAGMIAGRYGLSEADVETISVAAPMHDIGKLGIPDSIMLKPGLLTQQERRIMETHPETGAALLSGSNSTLLKTAHEIALTHHEKWDGTGYPSGLRGIEIPIAGRIVMLADQYDALRSPRPYKAAFPHSRAIEIILTGDGRTRPEQFDPDLLAIFRATHEDFAGIYHALQE